MFWRARSPLEVDDETWQLQCWQWLLDAFGGVEALKSRPLVLPTGDFFRGPLRNGRGAEDYFAQVAAHFQIDPSRFTLVPQDERIDAVVSPLHVVANAPQAPAGTFSVAQSGHMTITFDPSLVARPAHLVATLAHELCHAILLPLAQDPPGGPEMEEFATDLAVTFFGFGIFNANTASTFSAFRDDASGAQGWRFERRGYLSPAERAFALAVFLKLRQNTKDAALPHLDSGPAAYFAKAWKYVDANPATTTGVLLSHGGLKDSRVPHISGNEA